VMDIPAGDIDARYEKLGREGERSGYHLNPDRAVTRELVEGLLINERRYGYQACPCRLASGNREEDLDIICPCDYRDPDLTEYDACYCGLYVSQAVVDGDKVIQPIPERRPPSADRKKSRENPKAPESPHLSYPVWRCKVCGYLCARSEPPEVCPVCRAEKDRFERFMG